MSETTTAASDSDRATLRAARAVLEAAAAARELDRHIDVALGQSVPTPWHSNLAALKEPLTRLISGGRRPAGSPTIEDQARQEIARLAELGIRE